MASLYKRAGSPFWWVEYKDRSGQRRQISTKLRVDLVVHSRKAREFRDEFTATEREQMPDDTAEERWERWVPRFIDQRYGLGSLTQGRYKEMWNSIRTFLDESEIYVPRALGRQEVRDYIVWRSRDHTDLGLKRACKNTAIAEISFLGILMHEAVESGFSATNPCRKLGVKQDEPKRKPKITTAEHRLITRALKREPEWMRVAYKIAWEQGCRHSETCLELSEVDLARNTIGVRTKRHKDSIAEFPLSKGLRPMLRRLIREGRKRSYEMPRAAGNAWLRFFKKIGLGHLCFHCTRVTFVTRCYESGIPREHVMRLTGHASVLAHEVYPRLGARDDLMQELRARIG